MKSHKILFAVMTAALVLTLSGCSSSDYKSARDMYIAGDYANAYSEFTKLGTYKDSAALADECVYQLAQEDYSNGKYESAISRLNSLGEYKDSAELIAKATDMITAEALHGDWIAEYNLSDEFRGFLEEYLGDEMADFLTIKDLKIEYSLGINEDGTFDVTVTQASINEMLSSIKSGFSEGIIAHGLSEIRELVKENDVDIESGIVGQIVNIFETFLNKKLGVTIEKYLDGIVPNDKVSAAIKPEKSYGIYYVKDGVISFKLGDEINPAVFDKNRELLSINLFSRDLSFKHS